MHLESYYVPPENIQNGQFLLSGDELHHLSRVKRRRVGDRIQVVDGRGNAYESEILTISKSEALCRIHHVSRRKGETACSLTVAQGLLKGDRFDWFVEKATEIGADRIIPLTCERTVLNPSQQKVKRWRRIALSAMKQCGRSVWPDVTEPMALEDVWHFGEEIPVRLIAHAGDPGLSVSSVLDKTVPPDSEIMLLIGPEGGFTQHEVALCVDRGFKPASLGPRRLRSETASVVFSTLVLSQMKELEYSRR